MLWQSVHEGGIFFFVQIITSCYNLCAKRLQRCLDTPAPRDQGSSTPRATAARRKSLLQPFLQMDAELRLVTKVSNGMLPAAGLWSGCDW